MAVTPEACRMFFKNRLQAWWEDQILIAVREENVESKNAFVVEIEKNLK